MKIRLFSPFLYVLAVLIVGIGCENKKYEATADLYREAVADAVFAGKDEIYGGLDAITQDNEDLV